MRNYECKDCGNRKFKTKTVSRFGKRKALTTFCKVCKGTQLKERQRF